MNDNRRRDSSSSSARDPRFEQSFGDENISLPFHRLPAPISVSRAGCEEQAHRSANREKAETQPQRLLQDACEMLAQFEGLDWRRRQRTSGALAEVGIEQSVIARRDGAVEVGV